MLMGSEVCGVDNLLPVMGRVPPERTLWIRLNCSSELSHRAHRKKDREN
jgi:hypothetical protein